jgi:hypothetical protein
MIRHVAPASWPTRRPVLFALVLCLRCRRRLPLHIGRCIDAAMLESLYVVDNVSGTCTTRLAGGWTWVGVLELISSGCGAVNFAIGITPDTRYGLARVGAQLGGRCL